MRTNSQDDIYNQKCENNCGRTLRDGYVTIGTLGKKKSERTICRVCDRQERIQAFLENKRITTRLLMDATLDHARLMSKGTLSNEDALLPIDHTMIRETILSTMKACDELIGEFRRRQWMGHLCKRIHEAKRGLSGGRKGDWTVLANAMAGRALITIEHKNASITLIGADGDVASRLGVQGIDATKEDAIWLLWHAAYEMPEMKDDKEVGFG